MRHLSLAALLSLGSSLVLPAQQGGPNTTSGGFASALARYQECIKRIPFVHHTEGREKLADTRSLEALPILVADYKKPAGGSGPYGELTAEYARYTLAALFGRCFAFPEAVPALDALRTECNKPVDTWLWFHVLRILADNEREADVTNIAVTATNMMHRAAAIAAIGASKKGDLGPVILPNIVQFPKKEADRYLLLGAMSGAFWDRRAQVNDEKYRDALKAYIGLLGDDVGLPHTAKVQVARHLQWLLKGPALFLNPDQWLALLARGDVSKSAHSGGTAVAPRFFGIETDGERICYIVDMSDSMLKEIEESAKPKNLGPVTGQKPKKKRELLDESDLPWDRIKTRWDLAREQLRISLMRLTPDKYFSVVWFGDTSGTFDSCKGMVKASKANVDRVLAEIDAVKPAKAGEVRDEQAGTVHTRTGVMMTNEKGEKVAMVLKGYTNMHSGLRRAFSLTDKGEHSLTAYVDAEALTEGCDTIFLLSDGAPTTDDFYKDDKDYGEGNVTSDIEAGTKANRTPRLWYPGPYAQDEWLVEDVRRMNAFRRIRMHCIGLGEANDGLLKRLAEVGHGETFTFGKRK